MSKDRYEQFVSSIGLLIGALMLRDEFIGTLATRKFKQIEIDVATMLDNGETEEEATKYECKQLADFFNYCMDVGIELGIITEGDLDKYKEVFDEFSRIDTATQQGRP